MSHCQRYPNDSPHGTNEGLALAFRTGVVAAWSPMMRQHFEGQALFRANGTQNAIVGALRSWS